MMPATSFMITPMDLTIASGRVRELFPTRKGRELSHESVEPKMT